MEWHCFKCKQEMEEVFDIKMKYNDVDLPEFPGIRCPECGEEYLLEDTVANELNPAEESMEAK